MHVHACIHTYMHKPTLILIQNIHKYVCTCMHTCTHIRMIIIIHTCTQIHKHKHTHTQTNTHTYKHAHTQTHTYTHLYTQLCMYIYRELKTRQPHEISLYHVKHDILQISVIVRTRNLFFLCFNQNLILWYSV